MSLIAVYARLLGAYGPQRWWPAETRLEMIVGAILVQATAWTNAARAIANLKAAGALDLATLATLPEAELAQLIRPSGCFRAKARKIRAFVDHLAAHYDLDLDTLLHLPAAQLRRELLSLHGIGPETADCIVLYAAGRPAFVADASARRILGRLGNIDPELGYEQLREIAEAELPADVALLQEYHALLVEHGKVACRQRPRCDGCVLREICAGARPLS